MTPSFSLQWRQAPYAVPFGLCGAVLILGWENVWDATVTLLRIASVILIDYLLDPIRKYFHAFLSLIEYYCLRKVVYDPLVYIGLLKNVEFDVFVRVIYVCIIVWAVVLLIVRLPSWRRLLLSSDGRLRKAWVTVPLILLSLVCLFGGATLYHSGYRLHSAIIESVTLGLLVLLVWLNARYPNTNDATDFGNWLTSVTADSGIGHLIMAAAAERTAPEDDGDKDESADTSATPSGTHEVASRTPLLRPKRRL